MIRWVSVKDMIPDAFVNVLLYMPEEHPLPMVHEGYYANGQWFCHCIGEKLKDGEVTYWSPMPEIPTEEELRNEH